MRKIKFRLLYSDEFDYLAVRDGLDFAPLQEGAVIEQYTGLHDRNGVEIYEGDIWRIQTGEKFIDGVELPMYHTGVVSLSQEGLSVGDCLYWANTWICDGVGEVIGNIHENAELLDG